MYWYVLIRFVSNQGGSRLSTGISGGQANACLGAAQATAYDDEPFVELRRAWFFVARLLISRPSRMASAGMSCDSASTRSIQANFASMESRRVTSAWRAWRQAAKRTNYYGGYS